MTFDFTHLGEYMPDDLRGPTTHRHYGHGQLQALFDSRLVADRDNRVTSRDATPFEVALLRHLGLIPPYNAEAPELIRANLTWYGPIRALDFTRNGTPITTEDNA